MATDLNRKVAVVVLLVVIVISALGTWTILEATHSEKPVIYENPTTTGKVSVTIAAQPEQQTIKTASS